MSRDGIAPSITKESIICGVFGDKARVWHIVRIKEELGIYI